jgi:hypothetical protein
MHSNIHLCYGLGNATGLYHGQLFMKKDGVCYACLHFQENRFAQMMSILARAVRSVDECEVFIYHYEAPNEIRLDDATVDLLRKDPAAAIRSMQFPAQVVQVRDETVVPIGLRSGHDTLADAFGDQIYCRSIRVAVECPGCGRWMGPYLKDTTQQDCYLLCGSCDLVLKGEYINERWYAVAIEALLSLGLHKYYLPRLWNKAGPWISHGDLKQMYETYLKEKKDAESAGTTNGRISS